MRNACGRSLGRSRGSAYAWMPGVAIRFRATRNQVLGEFVAWDAKMSGSVSAWLC